MRLMRFNGERLLKHKLACGSQAQSALKRALTGNLHPERAAQIAYSLRLGKSLYRITQGGARYMTDMSTRSQLLVNLVLLR